MEFSGDTEHQNACDIFRKLNYIVSRCFEPSVILFISSHFAVVLQGSLHLEVQPGAARAWRELGLLVKIWVMFQDVWRWSSFPQQAVQWPPVSTEAVTRLIQNRVMTSWMNTLFLFTKEIVIILKLWTEIWVECSWIDSTVIVLSVLIAFLFFLQTLHILLF